uniref:Uncharacterized protein n=1 Tax=Physcomitrium patens TaxID=3218 RepID=A0A2K1L383_PHYPA|nr:hypothetical protein PHYPA_003278 [Physcomitrium patens]
MPKIKHSHAMHVGIYTMWSTYSTTVAPFIEKNGVADSFGDHVNLPTLCTFMMTTRKKTQALTFELPFSSMLTVNQGILLSLPVQLRWYPKQNGTLVQEGFHDSDSNRRKKEKKK